MRSFFGESVAIFLDVDGVRWWRVWASLVVGRSKVEIGGIQRA
jgi:hypothetical protein